MCRLGVLDVSLCISGTYAVEPLHEGHSGTLILVLITEVSAIRSLFNTLQYYTGTQNGVLITEVSAIQSSFNTLQNYTAIQRFVIERSHCILQLFVRVYNTDHIFMHYQLHMWYNVMYSTGCVCLRVHTYVFRCSADSIRGWVQIKE